MFNSIPILIISCYSIIYISSLVQIKMYYMLYTPETLFKYYLISQESNMAAMTKATQESVYYVLYKSVWTIWKLTGVALDYQIIEENWN